MTLSPFRVRTLLAMILAPLLASAALAAQDADPADTAPPAPAGQASDTAEARDDSQDASQNETKQAEPEAKADDERICRYVRLDMSSRRKTKVCRTVAEWRELNNIR